MSLSPRVVFGDLDLTDYPFSILMDEGDDGVAENVYVSLDTELRDGALVSKTSTENREVTRVVMVEGSDLLAVAEATAALARECEKPLNTLQLDPGDGFAPPKVYETFTAQIVERAVPGAEAANLRLFEVTWPALPFARSVDPFTVTGVTSTGTTTTVVNDASSTTGWTNDAGVAPSSGSGEVWVEQEIGAFAPRASLFYQPASPIDMTGLPYLAVRWRVTDGAGPFSMNPIVYADGLELPHISTQGDSTGGTNRYYVSTYACSDTSVAQLQIKSVATTGYIDGATVGYFRVDEVRKTNVAPMSGTLRQKLVNVEVPGSARCPMSLSVAHASSPLGDAMVYTSPALRAGYNPALSAWATTLGSTRTSNISGKGWSLTGSGVSFDVPTSFLPRGSFQLVGRLQKGTGAAERTFTATCDVRFGATVVSGSSRTQTTYAANLPASVNQTVELGSFTLPTADVPDGSAAVVRVNILADATAELDEAWLFYLPDDGSSHLSIVPCGIGTVAAGGPSSKLWLDAASVERPYPAAFIGAAADKSDARAPTEALTNWDEHLFPAGENLIFVVTPDALDALVTGEGYARWHTHPAA